MTLKRASFIDPKRIKERLFGGPYFVTGYMTENGERYISDDRKTMWFADTLAACWREGLNYEGHRIG